MNGSARVAELLDKLDDIENRLDPTPARQGLLIADGITVVIVVWASMMFDWKPLYPGLFLGLLLTGSVLSRVIPRLLQGSLREERNLLLAELATLGEDARGRHPPLPRSDDD